MKQSKPQQLQEMARICPKCKDDHNADLPCKPLPYIDDQIARAVGKLYLCLQQALGTGTLSMIHELAEGDRRLCFSWNVQVKNRLWGVDYFVSLNQITQAKNTVPQLAVYLAERIKHQLHEEYGTDGENEILRDSG
jgi:hypothetical protein